MTEIENNFGNNRCRRRGLPFAVGNSWKRDLMCEGVWKFAVFQVSRLRSNTETTFKCNSREQNFLHDALIFRNHVRFLISSRPHLVNCKRIHIGKCFSKSHFN
ncbi:uncharacterized protein LOC122498611 [Leptopilina heterotoma]|uniref:uncharacterized protein LOC122498611 n=1 Tax=Leptopilina heterotoma TaxID=63436 RepID=UPI001CA928D3|nr:uncharacterized protein LOC122498611 [Leptopilina heterotoma]